MSLWTNGGAAFRIQLRSRRTAISWILVLVPVLLHVFLVARMGLNMIVWDEFYYADFVRALREGGDWLPWLWRQHNEHRIIPSKILMIPMAFFTKWNTLAEMYASVVLAAVTIWGIWKLYRQSGGKDLMMFAPAAWLTCSLSQYQNMLFGMQTCVFFTMAGAVWAFYFLARPGLGSLVAAVICGAVASFSIISGFLVWPIGLAMMILLRRRRILISVWFVIAVASAGIYFSDYTTPEHSVGRHLEPSLGTVRKIVMNTVIGLGGPLGGLSVPWSRAIGGAILLITVILFVRHLLRGRLRSMAPLWTITLFSVATVLVIAAGRAALNVTPVESKYLTYATPAIYGLYLLLSLERRESDAVAARAFGAVTTLIVVGLLAVNAEGYYFAEEWRKARTQERDVLWSLERLPDEAARHIYFVPELRRVLPYLKQERLGPFSEPDNLLILTSGWTEGEAAGPILQSQPIEQSFVCPVSELRDVAPVFATAGTPNRSPVTMTLLLGTGEVVARQIVAAGEITDNEWVKLDLDEPLRDCEGRVLTLRLSSAESSPATAVTTWIYPAYYEGLFRQTEELRRDKLLGLALNAFDQRIFE